MSMLKGAITSPMNFGWGAIKGGLMWGGLGMLALPLAPLFPPLFFAPFITGGLGALAGGFSEVAEGFSDGEGVAEEERSGGSRSSGGPGMGTFLALAAVGVGAYVFRDKLKEMGGSLVDKVKEWTGNKEPTLEERIMADQSIPADKKQALVAQARQIELQERQLAVLDKQKEEAQRKGEEAQATLGTVATVANAASFAMNPITGTVALVGEQMVKNPSLAAAAGFITNPISGSIAWAGGKLAGAIYDGYEASGTLREANEKSGELGRTVADGRKALEESLKAFHEGRGSAETPSGGQPNAGNVPVKKSCGTEVQH